jgi:DNA-binding transcriptional ArsR family regulator
LSTIRTRRNEDRLDRILHALADRTRRRLLKRLSLGPARVSELARPFRMTRVAVSKHIRVLERARLVSRAIDGRVHTCTLEAAPLAELEEWLTGYRAFWGERLEALARYVERDSS